MLLTVIISAITAGVAAGTGAFFLGVSYRKNKAEKAIFSAEQEAEKIVEDAKKQAESKKKEVVIEGKDEVLRFRAENEQEINERRRDLQKQERRVFQKEENLDKKSENLEQRENSLVNKTKEIEKRHEEIEIIRKNQFDMLEKISGFTTKQARDFLLENLQEDLVHDKAVKITSFERELKEDCDKKAQEILSMAIQRCAPDHISEAVISVVPLPSDEMKGRIIGREGRNIRAFETLTGVDVIIDDTPESITLSAFDPVRREIARIALVRLVADGRIHPTKIEEMIEKAKADVERDMKEEGQRAVIEAQITTLHPELMKILGRLKYRTSYGQNVLNHSLEVAHICGMLASELGLDPLVARRAGLLHDIGKAVDHETEGSHVDLGVNLVKKYKESDAVIHAIQAHHNDVEPQNPIDFLVQAADTASAARPGVRRENLENYIKRLERLESLVSSFPGVNSCFAIQAGREVRVMIRPDDVKDEGMIPLAREICKKIESDLEYPGQVKVNLIRESRAIDFAK